MAISKTELVNKSLTLVGASPIVNITDDTENARVVNRVYEISLRSILSECKWNFATKRKLLTQTPDTVDWNYSSEAYVYTKPNGVIRIFGTNDDNAEWREEGKYILSDTQGLGIKYVEFVDDPNKYPAAFIDAFADKLCSDIAYMIVNSKSLGQLYMEKYEEISLPKATAENSQVGTQEFVKDDAWVNSLQSNGTVGI